MAIPVVVPMPDEPVAGRPPPGVVAGVVAAATTVSDVVNEKPRLPVDDDRIRAGRRRGR